LLALLVILGTAICLLFSFQRPKPLLLVFRYSLRPEGGLYSNRFTVSTSFFKQHNLFSRPVLLLFLLFVAIPVYTTADSTASSLILLGTISTTHQLLINTLGHSNTMVYSNRPIIAKNHTDRLTTVCHNCNIALNDIIERNRATGREEVKSQKSRNLLRN
jgi:hypothetical protein